jgi:hypothetical protein
VIYNYLSGTAAAQDAIVIDPEDPCGASAGLPAISRNGRMVAVMHCWSGGDDAHEWQVRFLDARSGRLQRGIVLSYARPGGVRRTPPARVRSGVARAMRALRGFVPLAAAPGQRTWRLREGSVLVEQAGGDDGPAYRVVTVEP